MQNIIAYFSTLSTGTVILRLFLSTLLGGIIGFERGKHGRAAGFRTHIILCVGATLTSLVGAYCFEVLDYTSDPMRIAAQVVSGIGFLGAGAIILKNKTTITGLTTAAGMWTTAVIGIATGAGFYAGAITGTVLLFCTTTFFTMFEKSRKSIINVYIEINDAHRTNEVISHITEICDNISDIQIQSPKSNISGAVAMMVVIDKEHSHAEYLISEFKKIDGVIFALPQ